MEYLSNPEYKHYIAITFLLIYLIAQKSLFVFIEFLFVKFSNKEKKLFIQELFVSIKKPINFFLLFVGLTISVKIWGKLPSVMAVYAAPIIKTTFMLSLFWITYNIVDLVKHLFSEVTNKFDKNLSDGLANFIVKAVKFFILAIGAMSILTAWGINVSAFLASLGLVGIALALAAKDTAANLFGSLVIFADKPFKIGDSIAIPNVEGTVEEIGIRSTKVRTPANAVITIPNATLANSPILNWTRMKKRRVNMTIGVTYDTTSKQINDILEDIRAMLKNHQDVHQDAFHIYFTDFNDSSLGILCYYFTKVVDFGEHMKIREDVNLKIMGIIEKHNASFAFPTKTIQIE